MNAGGRGRPVCRPAPACRPTPRRHAVAALVAAVLVVAGCHHARPASAPALPAHPAQPALVSLQHDIDTILAAPALERGYWGVLVKSLDTDDTLYAINARKLMMPASNMKIVTLAAAAARLGWDFQYRTTLMTAGAIADGTLNGDLVVVGSGDPSVTDATASTLFTSWAEQLKAQGITTIAGAIVGNDYIVGSHRLVFDVRQHRRQRIRTLVGRDDEREAQAGSPNFPRGCAPRRGRR